MDAAGLYSNGDAGFSLDSVCSSEQVQLQMEVPRTALDSDSELSVFRSGEWHLDAQCCSILEEATANSLTSATRCSGGLKISVAMEGSASRSSREIDASSSISNAVASFSDSAASATELESHVLTSCDSASDFLQFPTNAITNSLPGLDKIQAGFAFGDSLGAAVSNSCYLPLIHATSEDGGRQFFSHRIPADPPLSEMGNCSSSFPVTGIPQVSQIVGHTLIRDFKIPEQFEPQKSAFVSHHRREPQKAAFTSYQLRNSRNSLLGDLGQQATVLNGHNINNPLKRSVPEANTGETINKLCNNNSSKRIHHSATSSAHSASALTHSKQRPKHGSANDPQSVAARLRRERISERLKILQDLVPNGSKVDLVTMLEKAINYVKFLQLQIKILTTDEFWPKQQECVMPRIVKIEDALQAIASVELKKKALIDEDVSSGKRECVSDQ